MSSPRKPSRTDAAEERASLVGLGLLIKRLRREAGLTQAVLAQRAGISIRGLRELEYGEVEPHWGTLRRIAKGLNIRLGELLKAAEAAGDKG